MISEDGDGEGHPGDGIAEDDSGLDEDKVDTAHFAAGEWLVIQLGLRWGGWVWQAAWEPPARGICNGCRSPGPVARDRPQAAEAFRGTCCTMNLLAVQ